MFITSIFEKSDECSIVKFDSNWAYSRVGGSLTNVVGWTSTSFYFIGSSIKSKPKMDFSTPCQIHQLNHVVLCINNFCNAEVSAHHIMCKLFCV